MTQGELVARNGPEGGDDLDTGTGSTVTEQDEFDGYCPKKREDLDDLGIVAAVGVDGAGDDDPKGRGWCFFGKLDLHRQIRFGGKGMVRGERWGYLWRLDRGFGWSLDGGFGRSLDGGCGWRLDRGCEPMSGIE